ncbi:hypothetical protein LCGC14_1661320 [marine sediment metagenome]|uniref:Uncharacterized protein n=1 Tax=marine sediment metagenome TaxID=412755 RepID=A0A0F9K9W1_9ZZZZ
MTEIKLTIPVSLYEKMKKYPKIKWASIAQSALERYIKRFEITEKIAIKSKLTLDDLEEISNEITKRSWQQHKKYLKKKEE